MAKPNYFAWIYKFSFEVSVISMKLTLILMRKDENYIVFEGKMLLNVESTKLS